MQYPTTEVEIKMGHWIQRVKVAIAPSLPVDVLLGWDIFYPEVGQQLGLGLAVVTRSQARQGLPQGVTPPPLDHDSGGVEARGEEPPCDQLSCEETVCADDAGTRWRSHSLIRRPVGTAPQLIGRQGERNPNVSSNPVIRLGQKPI